MEHTDPESIYTSVVDAMAHARRRLNERNRRVFEGKEKGTVFTVPMTESELEAVVNAEAEHIKSMYRKALPGVPKLRAKL